VIGEKIEIMPDLGPEPWMRLPHGRGKDGKSEGPRAYAAFELYLHSAPAERSLRDLAAKVRKHRTQIAVWSSRFFWVARAEAWDRRQSEIAAQARERQIGEEGELWERRAKELREEKYTIGRQLRERGQTLVNQSTVEKKFQKTDAAGNQNITLKPNPRMQQTGTAMIMAGFELGDQSVQQASTKSDPEGKVVDVYETVSYEPEVHDK
jgi:hypothetical protein